MEALSATLLLAVTAMGLVLSVSWAWFGLARRWTVARAVIGMATLGMSAPSFSSPFVAWLWGGLVRRDGVASTGGWRVLDPFEGPQVHGIICLP